MTVRNRLMAGAVAASLLVGTFGAVPASAETLMEAMAHAYATNPRLAAARAELRAADEAVPQALSGWRPTVQLTGNVTRNKTTTQIVGNVGAGAVTTSGRTLRTSHDGAVQFTQPLFSGFGTVAGVRAAKNSVKAARATLLSNEQSVMLDAASSYMGLLQAMAVLDLRNNNVSVLTRQLEATQDRFEVGEITRTDVAQSEARLAGAVALRIQAQGDMEVARAAYERVIGLTPGSLETPGPFEGLPADLEVAIDNALAANPTYKAADFSSRAAEENIAVSRSSLLPKVNLEGQAAKGWDTVADQSEVESLTARVTFVVPLYQGGAAYSQLRQAKQQAAQSRLNADLARLQVREAAISAWQDYQTAGASTNSLQEQIRAAEIALEGVQREAEVGSRTVLDVLDAEQELLDARVSLVQAETSEVLAALSLLASQGRLTAQSLGLDVAVYDPEAYYRDVKNDWFGASID